MERPWKWYLGQLTCFFFVFFFFSFASPFFWNKLLQCLPTPPSHSDPRASLFLSAHLPDYWSWIICKWATFPFCPNPQKAPVKCSSILHTGRVSTPQCVNNRGRHLSDGFSTWRISSDPEDGSIQLRYTFIRSELSRNWDWQEMSLESPL